MRKVTHGFPVLLRCMTFIFLARRIQPFLSFSLVDREVEFLCTNNLTVIHFLGIIDLFLVKKKKKKVKGSEHTTQSVIDNLFTS